MRGYRANFGFLAIHQYLATAFSSAVRSASRSTCSSFSHRCFSTADVALSARFASSMARAWSYCCFSM